MHKETTEDWEAAEKKFNEVIHDRGNDPWDHRRSYAFRGLGKAMAGQGRWEEALKKLDEAWTISENCHDHRYAKKVRLNICDTFYGNAKQGRPWAWVGSLLWLSQSSRLSR